MYKRAVGGIFRGRTMAEHSKASPLHPKIEPGVFSTAHTSFSCGMRTNEHAVTVKTEPKDIEDLVVPTQFEQLSALGLGHMYDFDGLDDTEPVYDFNGIKLESDFLDVNVKKEPNSASLHHSTARGKNGNGQSSNAPSTPWVPPLWKQQYENIRKMRETRNAPVDTHGCFMLAEKDVAPELRRYQVLISLMLSSQTKDMVTGGAMTNLKKHGLTIENILKTPEEDIARMIHPVGFWKRKASYIKKSTEVIATKYNGDIPETLDGLMSLPGIGPKMAHLIMDFAWGKVSGIAVDTHVHRITHRLGWFRREITNPEEVRVTLESWFPREEWSDLNLLFVGFGQTICAPIKPRCGECLNKEICLESPYNKLGTVITVGKLGKRSPNKGASGKKKKIKVEEL